MGSATSKPQQEVKTFIPETPVEFSSSLLSQLDNSTESDYTRSQYAETYIQQRVNDELKNLNKAAVESLNKSLDSLTSGSAEADDASKSTLKANEKLDAITNKLKELNASKPQLGKDLVQAKSEVLSCLKENNGKPLNCWNEVETFKKLVNGL